MRRLIPLLLLVAPALLAAEPRVAIVAYHQVESVPQLGWSVSIENFTDQMRYLSAAGYHVIPIADAYEYLSGKRDSLPANPVVLTVDDGFEDAYTKIAPVLAQSRFPWSLYVYPHFISRGSDALKWKQVQQLSASGVDIQGHTMTHPHLMHRSHPEMSDADYAAWLHAELVDSKAAIEQKTGKPVRFLAYPYGDYDKAVEAEAARDGYVVGLLSEAGMNTRSTNLLELKRFPMMSDTTLAQFAKGVGAVLLDIRDVTPANESVATPRTISAVIAQQAELVPASVHIALLGENGTGKYDAATGRVTLTVAKFRRPRQQVVIYGVRTSDHAPVAAAWTFYTSAAAKARYDTIAQRLRELPLHHTQTKRQ